MSNAKSLTNAEFSAEIEKTGGVAVVDFWASWCGPCMMLAPVIDEIAADFGDKIRVYKVNVDEEPDLAVKFGIMSIPTLLFFRDGELFDKSLGAVPKESIEAIINRALS